MSGLSKAAPELVKRHIQEEKKKFPSEGLAFSKLKGQGKVHKERPGLRETCNRGQENPLLRNCKRTRCLTNHSEKNWGNHKRGNNNTEGEEQEITEMGE